MIFPLILDLHGSSSSATAFCMGCAQDTVVCTGAEATTIPTECVIRDLQKAVAARAAGEIPEGRGHVATTLRHASLCLSTFCLSLPFLFTFCLSLPFLFGFCLSLPFFSLHVSQCCSLVPTCIQGLLE